MHRNWIYFFVILSTLENAGIITLSWSMCWLCHQNSVLDYRDYSIALTQSFTLVLKQSWVFIEYNRPQMLHDALCSLLFIFCWTKDWHVGWHMSTPVNNQAGFSLHEIVFCKRTLQRKWASTTAPSRKVPSKCQYRYPIAVWIPKAHKFLVESAHRQVRFRFDSCSIKWCTSRCNQYPVWEQTQRLHLNSKAQLAVEMHFHDGMDTGCDQCRSLRLHSKAQRVLLNSKIAS